ncbi:putative sphingosine-1-phosphate lyase [bacterium HR15]|nr:putative sphingosine-1-phosphate lyase [bacterium HR15]
MLDGRESADLNWWQRVKQSFWRTTEQAMHRLPGVRERLEDEYTRIEQMVRTRLHPYEGEMPTFTRLPERGIPQQQVLEWMTRLRERETPAWQTGHVSGTVYHGGEEHAAFLSQVYALHGQSNPLHADLFPSTVKFEAEIVAMTASLLGAHPIDDPSGGRGSHQTENDGEQGSYQTDPDLQIVGTVTSGGTESILLAMKTYRDWGRAERGITQPEVVAPVTAHPAFDKAAHLFCIRLIRTPVDNQFRADVKAMRRAITRNTVALVGSAPSYPHGAIDPIPQIAALAQEHRIGLHVDACLGGFILPFIERLGYPVPPYDFRVPGVTSMSVDPHKYGYTPKGLSVVLYRGRALRRYQYFTYTDWPGGLYASPTLPGSRPGALSAAGWAAMVTLGESGYLEAARRIMETATTVRQGIEAIPELRLMGVPLFLIAFTSDSLNIYEVLDRMAARGWRLVALQRPPGAHFAITLRHTQPGVAEQFLNDLRSAVNEVKQGKATSKQSEGMAPIYGMANSLPFRGVIDEVLHRYLDALYDL